MKTYFDIQQLLKRFGTIIYTGDRSDDLDLMGEELGELHKMNMIDNNDYLQAKMIIKQEKSRIARR
ncbi:YqgQ family protein [Bacillus sp. H-16]|uniref:YqgQ family protein n=1 Tax=Alteribacter salitolerans TaxID=2912333 RepID=UPI0019654929|nr:YqgQ family protein [Alteribacter salitolerans]MBM7097335.1 YqgQ family protein [Alteribacter salitolerans]